MNVRVSVVIPTYKRPKLLNRCLQALAAQDLPPAWFEIIIVDDAADVETKRMVEAWKEQMEAVAISVHRLELVPYGDFDHNLQEGRLADRFIDAAGPCIRYIASPIRRGPAAARNIGWRAALGEIIAFTDDDCLPKHDWLRNGLSALNSGVMGVSGRVIVPLPANPTDYQLDFTGLERSEFVTANCFYRRKVLEEENGFDERFTMAWREDSDLYFRILKRGYLLGSAPDAQVVHPLRRVSWGVSISQQRRSMFNALLYKKHPRLYRRKLQPDPPFHYYGIVAALVMLVFSVPARDQILILYAGSLWLVATFLFFAHRIQPARRTGSHVLEMLVTSIIIPPLSVFWRLRGSLKYRVFFI